MPKVHIEGGLGFYLGSYLEALIFTPVSAYPVRNVAQDSLGGNASIVLHEQIFVTLGDSSRFFSCSPLRACSFPDVQTSVRFFVLWCFVWAVMPAIEKSAI